MEEETAETIGLSTSCCPPWSELLPDLLGRVIAHLPFPADLARFRAVCRPWRSAARQHVRQLPWIVFPDCSFCTIGDDGGAFFSRIPGLPENVTCLGAAADGWLALDCTDDVFRRTPTWVKIRFKMKQQESSSAAADHDEPIIDRRTSRHTYILHNPFSGEIVPLPELDSMFGRVPRTFEIRKVLMMRGSSNSSPHDMVAVTTNSWKYNVVFCCPGKGKCVVPNVRVFDVAFVGNNRLYGITPEEELVAFDLATDKDGRPIVTKYRRVIKQPLANGAADPRSWIEVKDLIVTTRHLVTSHGGGDRGELLLMVKHHVQCPPISESYTRMLEVFKADINVGSWVPITTDALGNGEALFLGQSFSKSTRMYGDIKEGHVYFLGIDGLFDTRSWASRPFSLPVETKLEHDKLLTWLLPPKLVV
ncbi:hypothetical protein QOZ80_8BG0642090 [Eleusine coracana subsp. coracana]|nr:hypothetical protein QOZ80_8BG0642090 [Eleusine coracana subsp. coracana]